MSSGHTLSEDAKYSKTMDALRVSTERHNELMKKLPLLAKNSAEAAKVRYDAFISAGFSEDAALKLLTVNY